MKQHFLPAIKITLCAFLLLLFVYTGIVWAVAQLAPGNGKGETLTQNGRIVGFKKEGQLFDSDNYFWGRPSAVNYNAAGSGASNAGPSNPIYLQELQNRIDSFLAHHPGIEKHEIPSEMVTASASGLDPDISVEGAKIQVRRVAQARHLTEQAVFTLVAENTERPLLGILGPTTVNVLQLNLALDELAVAQNQQSTDQPKFDAE